MPRHASILSPQSTDSLSTQDSALRTQSVPIELEAKIKDIRAKIKAAIAKAEKSKTTKSKTAKAV